MRKLFVLTTFWILAGLGVLQAQTYPVVSTLVMPFPHSTFLSEYYAPSAMNMQVTAQLNDFTVPSQRVKLQFAIEGNGVTIRTNANYQPPSNLMLTPGVPLLLQGSDLYDALNATNLDLQGFSAAAFSQNGGKLPEGQYNFCITVLDYNSGKELSLPACANIFIQYEVPPVLITPDCGTYITPSAPQNIRFSWQVAGLGQPSFFGLNTYVLHVYQITDPEIADPLNAVQNSKAVKVWESQPTSLNALNLDFSTVLLVPGNKYVCRIQGIGPEGKETFQNEGYGEWCWFNYGYPTDGNLNLQDPFDGKQFEKTDPKVFSWDASDKGLDGQPYDYTLTIVELTDTSQSLESALTNNATYHQEVLNTTTSQSGANFQLQGDLTADKKYAWKVIAKSDGQLVAESELRSFYGHSLIDHFYAANQKIKVIQTGNADLANFSGRARVQLSTEETDFIDVDFTGLEIQDVAGQMILKNGQIDFDLSERDAMDIDAELPVNGVGTFEYVNGTIDKTGLKVDGRIVWLLPHAVAPGEESEVHSKPSTFVMNADGELSGEAGTEPFQTTLLAPKDFIISLKTTSKLQLADNELVIQVRGDVTVHPDVKTIGAEPLIVEFQDYQNSLDYIEIDNLIGVVNGGVAPIEGLKLEMIPIAKGVLDFSEEQSPGKLSSNKNWKGFYVEEYKTRLNVAGFDPTNQIAVPERIDIDQTTDGTSHRFWIGGTGLNLKTDFDLNEVEGLRFNGFQTETFRGEFEISKGEFKNVRFIGTTKVPFINDDSDFDFEIPTTSTGLEEGYLEGLEDLEFIYNPYGGENRMEFVINRAAFINNEYLSLNCDIDCPELDVLIEGQEDIRVYGDHVVGIGGKNTSVALDIPIIGRFKDLDMTVTDIGASFLGGEYAVSLVMEAFLSEGFADVEGGPPVFTISSVAATSAEAAPGTDLPQPAIEVPEDLAGEEEIKPTGFDVNIETPFLDCGAYLLFYQNDPTWGTRFAAGVNASLKIPGPYNAGGNMTLGFVDGMDYWYLDLYFEDVEGIGIPIKLPYVGNICNILGMEGQIFRHVKSTQTDEGDFELELSPRTQFGAKMFVQIMDGYTHGFLVQADLGVEAEIQGNGYLVDNFEVIMGGQASFLNMKFRMKGGGMAMEAIDAVGVADEIIDMVFPQSFEMLGKQITLDSKGLSEGSSIEIGSLDGGEGILLGAAVSSSPSLEIGAAYGGYKFYGSGDTKGNAEIELEIAGLTLDAELIEKTAGNFSLDIGDLSTSFSGDYGKKKADLAFDYQSLNFAAGVDAIQKSGYFEVGYDGNKIGAHANVTAKTGGVDFVYGDKKIFLDVDGNALSSEFKLQYGDYKFENALNLTEKSGSMLLVTPIGEVDIMGSTTGAKFRAETDDYLFHVEGDFPSKTGLLAIEFPNHELRGQLFSDRGEVFLKKDDFEIGLSGKYDGTAGDLHVREGDFVFDIGADVNASTGFLSMTTGSETFESNYDLSDSSFIRFFNSDNLYEAVLAGKYFRSQAKTSDHHFLVEIDADKIAGRTIFSIPSFLTSTEFDASTNYASAVVEIQDHRISSSILDDSMAIAYANGGLDFKVAGKYGGGGSVYFADADQDLATGFSYDMANEAGSILFHKDEFTIGIAGNKTANTGSLNLEIGDDFFRAGLEDSLYLATHIGDFGFSAMRSTDKMAASFAYSDNEISVAKMTNGEALRLVIPSNTFAISRDGSNFAASYAGDNLEMSAAVGSNEVAFGFKKDAIEVNATANTNHNVTLDYQDSNFGLGITGDLNTASFSTTVNKDGWSGTVAAGLQTNEITLGLSKSGIGVEGSFTASAKTLEYEIGDIKIEGGFQSGLPLVDFSFGANKLSLGSLMDGVTGPSISGGGIKFEMGDVNLDLGNLALGNSPDLTIDLAGTSFTINPSLGNGCAIDLKRENNPVSFIGNEFEETISGNRIKVALNPDDSKNIVVETSDLLVDVAYTCGQLPAIKVTKSGKQYAFVIKPDEVLLQYEDNLISYANSNHELKVEKGSNYTFKVSDDGLETDLDGYFLKTVAGEFTAGTGQTYILLNDSKAAIHADDKFIELNSNDTYKIQADANKYITTTPNSLEIQVDSKRLFVDDTEVSASDTQENFSIALTANSLGITKDDKSVSIDASEVRFDKGSDYISVKSDELGARYDDKILRISTDKKVSYQDSDRSLEASPSSLAMNYQGKILEVNTDGVLLELNPDQKFRVQKDILSAQWGQYQVDLMDPLTDPAFAYSDNNNSLGLSKSEVSVMIDGKGVVVGEDKLHILVDGDHLKYDNDDLSFKYGRYQADFTDWDAVNLTNGLQQFGISRTELTAAIDQNNTLKVVTDPNAPSMELVHDDTRFAISTTSAEFDYDGMHYALGSTGDYIAVHEIGKPQEGFVFNEDGIKYRFSDTDYISVAPQGDYMRLQLDNKHVAFRDDYSLQFGIDDYTATILRDLSVEFFDGSDHRIDLNKPDYMVGYTYVPEDVYLRLKRFDDNYIGLQAGVSSFAGFVKPAADKSIEIGGIVEGLGQASVAVNGKKDIYGKLKHSDSNLLAVKIGKAKKLEKVHVRIADSDVINMGEDVDVFGEELPGVAAVGGDGPSHIAMISEKALGWAVGGLKWRYTIGTNLSYVAQGRIKTGLSIPLMCADGRFGFELSAKKCRVKLGDKNDYVGADLLCIPGLGGLMTREGYAEFGYEVGGDGLSMDVGMGYRISIGGSGSFDVDVGACTLGFSAGFEAYLGFGGEASLTIPANGEMPSVSFGPIFAELGASAYLRANACFFSIDVSAGISGRLELSGGLDGAKAEGKASGHFSACGLSKSFEFDAKLEI